MNVENPNLSVVKKYQKNHLFVIAEAGTNHNGDFDKAKQFVDIAVNAGCSAIKFQHVYANEILHPNTGDVKLPGGVVPLFQKFKSLEQTKDFFKRLMEYCQEKKILFLCTPFGFKSLTELKEIGVEAYKIASPESNYAYLNQKVIACKKDVFISTGVCTEKDVLDIICEYQDQVNYVLLHCVTQYPANENEYNLLTLFKYKSLVKNRLIGVSDHTLDPFFIPMLANYLSMGLQKTLILEKHITLNPKAQGLDDPIGITATDLNNLVQSLDEQTNTWIKQDLKFPANIFKLDEAAFNEFKVNLAKDISSKLNFNYDRVLVCLNNGHKVLTSHEEKIYATTNRSLRAIKDINQGDVIDHHNSQYLRSELNLKPGLNSSYNILSNKIWAKEDIKNGEGITLDKLRFQKSPETKLNS